MTQRASNALFSEAELDDAEQLLECSRGRAFCRLLRHDSFADFLRIDFDFNDEDVERYLNRRGRQFSQQQQLRAGPRRANSQHPPPRRQARPSGDADDDVVAYSQAQHVKGNNVFIMGDHNNVSFHNSKKRKQPRVASASAFDDVNAFGASRGGAG